MDPIHYLNDDPYERYSFSNRVTDSEEEAFLMSSTHFFGAHFFVKNVSEKQNVFCLQTQTQIRSTVSSHREPPSRPHFDLIQPRGLSITITRESDKDATTGGVKAGGNRLWMGANRIGEWR
jgi:hypothetical protein